MELNFNSNVCGIRSQQETLFESRGNSADVIIPVSESALD